MIQRIQSIYLLLVTALMATFLFLPFAYTDAEKLHAFTVQGLSTANGEVIYTWAIFALVAVTALVALLTIFLYKNRPLQIRLCQINILFIIGLYVVIGLYIYLNKLTVSLSPTIAIPFVALIFDWLACRAIKKDERLVRSLDRIR